jgi:periplasmic divalent cation tolerance protein
MEDTRVTCVSSLVTTVATLADAQRLARLIVGQRLGACVQIDPAVVSHYAWQGQLREEPELRLTIKTLPERLAALQAFFDQHHPYALPQFLATDMAASPAYAGWVRAAVSG